MEELYKVMDDLLEVEFQMKAGMDILKELEEFYICLLYTSISGRHCRTLWIISFVCLPGSGKNECRSGKQEPVSYTHLVPNHTPSSLDFPTRSIPMPENPVRTVYGLEHLNQTTAKVHYFMIHMLSLIHISRL